MISIIIYRLFFSSGRHKKLYVLVMAAYYTCCFLFVSSSLTALTGLDDAADGRLAVDDDALTAVTTADLRRRDVVDRWTLRARLLKRFCRTNGTAHTHRAGELSTLTSRRLQLASCAAADTADRFWLRTFTQLARQQPGYRCTQQHHGVSRCEDEARRLGALTGQDISGQEASWRWTHVVTVRHPFARLAAAFLRQPWPSQSSTFSEAVSAVTTGKVTLPAQAAPLTSVCDLCAQKFLIIVQAEMEDEELDELGRQLDIGEYLQPPPQSPHSPARAAAAGDAVPVARLLRQLSADQLRQLHRLYQSDFSALPFYNPAEFDGHSASHESL